MTMFDFPDKALNGIVLVIPPGTAGIENTKADVRESSRHGELYFPRLLHNF